METEEIIKHKQRLVSAYMKNLQHLELRQAAQGGLSTDVGVLNQIENVQEMIQNLKEELANLTNDNSLNAPASLIPLPTLLQKYDSFISQFSEELRAWKGESHRFETSVLVSLARATPAKHAFVGRYIDNQWKITSEHPDALREINSLIEKDVVFRNILTRSTEYDTATITSVSNIGLCIFIPFVDSHSLSRNVMVLQEVRAGFEIDDVLYIIIRSILFDTNNLTTSRTPEYLESTIYNNLKRIYGYVSDTMYNRQFYLFNQRLETMTVHFEPVIAINAYSPRIYGWEALARNKETNKAPQDLFDMAELWGVRFRLQLDMYFLRTATDIYIIDHSHSDNEQIMRKDRMLPLSVNVYPDSLIGRAYLESVRQIESKGYMPMDKLILEISEKSPIPMVKNIRSEEHIIDAFREKLFPFKDIGIEFSIDDFGVGYASSSRLSRIGPSFIKVDRDALLDMFGNYTLEYVIGLARRMPGNVKVIVEGYDDESRFPLRKLYDMGVRYIQTRKYGGAVPHPDNRLSSEKVKLLREILQGTTD